MGCGRPLDRVSRRLNLIIGLLGRFAALLKARDVMTGRVSRVEASATVLEAVRKMLEEGTTGALVMRNGIPVAMFSERSLLRRFIPLNRRPEDVKVEEAMPPGFPRIDHEASVAEAIKTMIERKLTRVAVFRKDEMVGWVALQDLKAEGGDKDLLELLLRYLEREPKD